MHRRLTVKNATAVDFKFVVGLDLGDRESQFVVLNLARKVVDEGKVATTVEAMRTRFATKLRFKIIVETGTHAPWVVRLLRELGHHVVLANSRLLPLITKGKKKSDRSDAENLARLGLADEELLSPVYVRSEQTLRQIDLEAIAGMDVLDGTSDGFAITCG